MTTSRPSARSLLITLFGDVLLPTSGEAPAAALTRVLESLDVSPAAVRQALRRLVQQGLLEHDGVYRLSPAARARFEHAAERIYRSTPPQWDGRWRLLTYHFETGNRGTRDALRKELSWLGYGQVDRGVWVCPWDHGVRLESALVKHGIDGTIDAFTSRHHGDDRELAARAYDLDALAARHQNFLERWESPLPADDALATRLQLVHDRRSLLFLDPELPTDLVGDDWLGGEVATRFHDVYQEVGEAAWRQWESLGGQRPSAPTPVTVASPRPTSTEQTDDPGRVRDFREAVQAGHRVEPDDWMPAEYRALNIKFIEMHANSEIMGALPEREWIARAPSLRRKRSLAAKVQDEVGHAHLLYSVAESLGRPRSAMTEDLVAGRGAFHNVFHYPTKSWGDVAVIGFLVDGAAIVTQRALLETSYAPYVRTMRRIVAEESLHQRHGEDLALALAAGTDHQVEMLQEAVNRWWEPILHFFGTDLPAEKDHMIQWGIKTRANEESRQEFLTQYVPKLWDAGIEPPDDTLRWDATQRRWIYQEPDWDELRRVVRRDPPTEATATRLWWRQLLWREQAWVRSALSREVAA